MEVLNGLDQGGPYSGTCYVIYNADLTKITVLRAGKWILLFVDDAVIIMCSKNFSETHKKLQDIIKRIGGVFEWAKSHNRRLPQPRQAQILGEQ